jgi:hypothetical protein
VARRLEQRIAAVREALHTRETAAARRVCIDALRTGPGALVAMVADALREDDRDLLDRLPEAFGRLCEDQVKRDPGCVGKAAIARALYRADVASDEVLLPGIELVQMEPVFGGRVDTAAELRGVCGMALAAMRHPQAMSRLAALLADPERAARIAAARALAASGDRTTAEPLLRLRIAVGEPDPEALAEHFAALLELAGDDAVAFVAERLDVRSDAIIEAAALSLGGSRRPAALQELARRLSDGTVLGARRRVLSLAIALLRSEAAWSLLLERVAEADTNAAADALHGLATFAHDAKLHARVQEALAARGDPKLSRLADELWTDEE